MNIFKTTIESERVIDPALREQLEKAMLEVKKNRIIRDILLGEDKTCMSYRTMSYEMLGGIVLSVMVSGTFLLIPMHNILDHPDYWYEYMLQVMFGYIPLNAAAIILNSSHRMNTDSVKTFENWIALYSVGTIATISTIMALYCTWKGLGYDYPIPFQGVIFVVVLQIISYTFFWFQFPKAMRENRSFNKRLKYLYIAFLYSFIVSPQYHVLGIAFRKVPSQYQWVLALCLPLVREWNSRYMLRLSIKQMVQKRSRWSVLS